MPEFFTYELQPLDVAKYSSADHNVVQWEKAVNGPFNVSILTTSKPDLTLYVSDFILTYCGKQYTGQHANESKKRVVASSKDHVMAITGQILSGLLKLWVESRPNVRETRVIEHNA